MDDHLDGRLIESEKRKKLIKLMVLIIFLNVGLTLLSFEVIMTGKEIDEDNKDVTKQVLPDVIEERTNPQLKNQIFKQATLSADPKIFAYLRMKTNEDETR